MEENINRSNFPQTNINSIRNKLQFLSSQIVNNVDVLLVSETKLADFFPMAQILLDVFFKLHRLGRFSNGRGILYVKDNKSSCLPTDHRLPEI